MNVTPLLAVSIASALLVAACGGGSAEPGHGGNAVAPSGNSSSEANISGSSVDASAADRTGTVMGSCGSMPTITVRWFDSLAWFSFDAPMVFLAQPGPITATLLATPARDSSWAPFRTSYSFSQNIRIGDLGISSDDSVGKSVTTVSIPGQPPGVPISFSAHFRNNRGAFGTNVMTGFVYENGFACCDGPVRVPAQVSFGANNTAIVSFLPDDGVTTPLRIQLTNVTSVSGCSV
jgi:hypothetical protein